jgi:hypothetical protein
MLPSKHAVRKTPAAARDAAIQRVSKKMSKIIVHHNLRQLQDAHAQGYVSEIHIQEVVNNSSLKDGVHYEIHWSLLGRSETYVFTPFGKDSARQFALNTAFTTIRPFIMFDSVVINTVYLPPKGKP